MMNFGALSDTQTQPGFGATDDIGSLTDGPIDTVLRLQALEDVAEQTGTYVSRG